MYLKLGGVLGVVWMLGMIYGYRLGGAIYLLLAVAAVMVIYGLAQWWKKPA